MSTTKIELSLDSVKISEDPSHIQYIPCHIEHEGEVPLDSHFNPYVTKTGDSDKGGYKIIYILLALKLRSWDKAQTIHVSVLQNIELKNINRM